jgi:hypothetical protein
MTVLKLLGAGRMRSCIAARFPPARVSEAHALPERPPAIGISMRAS